MPRWENLILNLDEETEDETQEATLESTYDIQLQRLSDALREVDPPSDFARSIPVNQGSVPRPVAVEESPVGQYRTSPRPTRPEQREAFTLQPEVSGLREKIEFIYPREERTSGNCKICNYKGGLIVTGHSGDICIECYQEREASCTVCGSHCLVGDFIRNIDFMLCFNCLHEYYFRCNYCENETWFLSETSIRTDEGLICTDCIQRRGLVNCGDCTVLHFYNSLNLCRSCQQIRDPGFIHNHSFIPNFRHFGKDGLKFGVELEMEPSQNHNIERLLDQGKDILREEAIIKGVSFLYLKHDGSLAPGGIELVSHPASLGFHQSEFHWGKLLARMKANHFLADETDTCGLHIHMSKDSFTKNDLIKIGVTIFKHRQLFEILGRRNSNSYCHFDRIRGYAKDNSALLKNIENAVNSGDRYEAVNFTNELTVELRFFKGTMLNETLMFSLEIANLIASLVKETNIRELRKQDSFQYVTNYLLQNASKPTQKLIQSMTKDYL